MRRYMLFYGEDYYPLGGMEDFHGSYDTQQEAIDYFNTYIDSIVDERKDWGGSIYETREHILSDHWAHVFDTIDSAMHTIDCTISTDQNK